MPVNADSSWPELSEVEFVSGRAATEADTEAGRAAFVIKIGGKVSGEPLDIAVPQYAYHLDGDIRTPVVIIQAEQGSGVSALGFLNIETQEIGAGLVTEFELLGTDRSKLPGTLSYSNLALSFEARDLVGVWPMCVDPDKSPKDSLLFESDGSGYVLRKDKPNIEFLYRVEGTSLTLLARVGEQAIPISLEISPDERKLLLYSDKTKNTSFYVRESDFAEFDCDSE